MSRPLNREKIVFSKVVLRQWDGHMQKNEARFLHYIAAKANSKWIMDLTVRNMVYFCYEILFSYKEE